MRKLISANLLRMRKSRVFWLCIALTALAAGVACVNQYHWKVEYGTVINFDSFFFGSPLVVSVAAAIFTPLFLGTEYADGTLRNKLISGCTREGIYLSSLLTILLAGLFFILAFMAVVTLLGIPLFGMPHSDAKLFLMCMVIGLLASAAFCALYTMLSTLIPNRAISAVAVLLFMAALYLAATVVYARLCQPEMTTGVYSLSVNGSLLPEEPIPNPLYLTGTKRAVYQFFLDFLPTGQVISLQEMNIVHPWLMPVWSLLIMLLSTGTGLLVFRNKDFS